MIIKKEYSQIDVFTYRAENTNGAVLDALSKRIVQVYFLNLCRQKEID